MGSASAAPKGNRESLGTASGPMIPLIDRPVVVESGAGEEGRAERVVGMMMGKNHIADGLGPQAELGEGLEDGSVGGNHTGVDDDYGFAVTDEPHSSGHM